MTTFGKRIRPAVDHELQSATIDEAAGQLQSSFKHLERAHVLGQASTVQHVRVHVRMLGWALRHHAPSEALGQVMRIAGAATKTALGWVPSGNTGGSAVSPFKSQPIPPDLQAILAEAGRPPKA